MCLPLLSQAPEEKYGMPVRSDKRPPKGVYPTQHKPLGLSRNHCAAYRMAVSSTHSATDTGSNVGRISRQRPSMPPSSSLPSSTRFATWTGESHFLDVFRYSRTKVCHSRRASSHSRGGGGSQ